MGAAITNTMEVAGLVADARGNRPTQQNEAAAGLTARAQAKDREAAFSAAAAGLTDMELALTGRRAVAGVRSGFAASGVRVDVGSAGDVAADTAAWGEYERGRAGREAELSTWALRNEAAALHREAAALRSGGAGDGGGKLRALLGGGQTLLGTGAGKILMKPSSVFL